jgi:hypothetical protein
VLNAHQSSKSAIQLIHCLEPRHLSPAFLSASLSLDLHMPKCAMTITCSLYITTISHTVLDYTCTCHISILSQSGPVIGLPSSPHALLLYLLVEQEHYEIGADILDCLLFNSESVFCAYRCRFLTRGYFCMLGGLWAATRASNDTPTQAN